MQLLSISHKLQQWRGMPFSTRQEAGAETMHSSAACSPLMKTIAPEGLGQLCLVEILKSNILTSKNLLQPLSCHPTSTPSLFTSLSASFPSLSTLEVQIWEAPKRYISASVHRHEHWHVHRPAFQGCLCSSPSRNRVFSCWNLLCPLQSLKHVPRISWPCCSRLRMTHIADATLKIASRSGSALTLYLFLQVFEHLVIKSASGPVDGNKGGSYLTMFS